MRKFHPHPFGKLRAGSNPPPQGGGNNRKTLVDIRATVDTVKPDRYPVYSAVFPNRYLALQKLRRVIQPLGPVPLELTNDRHSSISRHRRGQLAPFQ